MNNLGYVLVLWMSAAVVRVEGGQIKSVCILIPAYDLEDYAEGENEEEEVRGWGPGPAGKIPSYGHQGVPIVTHTVGGGEAGGEAGPPPTGAGNVSGSEGQPKGSLRDPSKPPGPNPKWGYWEWDSESSMWELEDYRRRRRRRQVAGSTLAGRIQCGPGTIIHVDKVTLGFSINNRCLPVRHGCQVSSTVGRQVAHCEGESGICELSVAQQFLKQPCGRRTNYARILYECIPEVERHNICEAKTFQSAGSLVLTSPFNGSPGGAQSQHLSCECEVNRGNNEALAIPWIRTRLGTGVEGACGEELLLLDTWDDSANRYRLQEELCGLKSQRDKVLTSSAVKLTYLPSSTNQNATGFLLRIEGKPDSKAALSITCTTVAAEGGPAPGAAPPPVPPALPPSGADLSASSPSASVNGPARRPLLPVNFDLRKYPGLLNKTLSAWRARMNQQSQQQQGSAAGQLGLDSASGGASNPGSIGQLTSHSTDDTFNVTGASGTLSAVVASLSSIIVVMGSIGVYMWYRRSQRKKQQKDAVYFDRRSTVRSNATLYSEPTYLDPADPSSGIPTSSPVTLKTPQVNTISAACSASQQGPALKTSRQQPVSKTPAGDGQRPALPVRPPRPKKDKVRRLPKEEDVIYDNNSATSDVKVVMDTDYASLDEISEALSSHDGSVDTEA